MALANRTSTSRCVVDTNNDATARTQLIRMAMAAMAMKAHDSISVSVPTKLGQGQGQGDQAETTRNRYQDDAFSRYSNDFVRMKSLLLSSREEDDHGNEDDDLDALASINRALSSAGISSISQLNRDKRRRGNNSSCIKQGG